jgi:hypothetical protein
VTQQAVVRITNDGEKNKETRYKAQETNNQEQATTKNNIL